MVKKAQFPVTWPTALAMCKYQGGAYNKSVYVALSRITNRWGLRITNKGGDFKFHHGKKNTTEHVRANLKIHKHQLTTVTNNA